MIIIALVLFFICAGYLEQMLFRTGGRPWVWIDLGAQEHSRLKFLGWIIPSYHAPLLLSWFIPCWLAGQVWFFPIGAVIQDWSFWKFHPMKRLDENAGINSSLGGWYIYGNATSRNNWWLPFTYIVGIGMGITNYYIHDVLLTIAVWLFVVGLRIVWLRRR